MIVRPESATRMLSKQRSPWSMLAVCISFKVARTASLSPKVSENAGENGYRKALHRCDWVKSNSGLAASGVPTYGITSADASPSTSSNKPNGVVIPAVTPLFLSRWYILYSFLSASPRSLPSASLTTIYKPMPRPTASREEPHQSRHVRSRTAARSRDILRAGSFGQLLMKGGG